MTQNDAAEGALRNQRRERRLADKQQASSEEILDAAAKAFARRGYAATSIDDVAEELGCTKGRVYHYFRTKGELFIGIHHRSLVWALEAVEPVMARTDLAPDARLRELVRRHAMHLMEHTDYMGPSQYHTEMNLAREGRHKDAAVQAIFEMRHRFEAIFVKTIEDGTKKGLFRKGDASLQAKAILGSVNWMSVWFRSGIALDTQKGREKVAEEFSLVALHGLAV